MRPPTRDVPIAVGLLPRVRARGSICGAMPILSVLHDGVPARSIERVSGVVNGTTNFMLTPIESGSSYGESLAETQLRMDVAAVREARACGRAIRLVGVATRDRAEVRLRELDASDPLAAAPAADNVVVEGDGFRRIYLSGPGAGEPETTSAVVADLLEPAR